MLQIVQLTPDFYERALRSAAALGAIDALKLAGVPIKEFFTREELYKKYGRQRVDYLIDTDKLKGERPNGGSRVVYRERELLISMLTNPNNKQEYGKEH